MDTPQELPGPADVAYQTRAQAGGFGQTLASFVKFLDLPERATRARRGHRTGTCAATAGGRACRSSRACDASSEMLRQARTPLRARIAAAACRRWRRAAPALRGRLVRRSHRHQPALPLARPRGRRAGTGADRANRRDRGLAEPVGPTEPGVGGVILRRARAGRLRPVFADQLWAHRGAASPVVGRAVGRRSRARPGCWMRCARGAAEG